MLQAAPEPMTPTGQAAVASAGPEPAPYRVPLPEWLQRCLAPMPPAAGGACPTDAEALLASAFDFAYQLHEGQYRASGEPYIIHPIAVADLLRDIGASACVIAAAASARRGGGHRRHPRGDRAALRPGGAGPGGGGDQARRHPLHQQETEAQAENLRRMFLAMASDIRVVLVKLADRLHNMRTLGALKPEKQQRIARETREIYAPLANRLGIGRSSGNWRTWPSRSSSPRPSAMCSSRWPPSAVNGSSAWR